MRCRPYRSSPALDWTGGPELVCRAVHMVIDGALDTATEPQLAARLGVSTRHLRRLFDVHLGVTPDRLARSHRAHFARRLLDDTDLTVTEVAFAAGFGSVRQLHRACREVFHAPPRELRARRRRADRLAADGGLSLRLSFDGPLEWPAMLAYFEARAIPGVESVSANTYRRTIVLDGDPGVLELSSGGPDHLLLRAHLPHWHGLIHLAQRARRIFNLDAPVEEAVEYLCEAPVIGHAVRARPGLRPPGTWDPFEIGVRAIIGQQVSVAGASTITGRLVRALGDPVPGLDRLGLTHTFPSPARLATGDLTGLGLTRSREGAVRTFATAVHRDELALDRSLPLERLVDAVTSLRGLGPWTAQYIALRLGERDAFPAQDLGLLRALPRLAPGASEPLARLAERWSPWRATAATHLWLADGAEISKRRAA